METWLKRGAGQAEAAEADAQVREAVERILARDPVTGGPMALWREAPRTHGIPL